ncbi:putative zinc finger CCCH domain-containing protein 53 [Iris pallida]|uniref:Zinc finger CCCH domain-containing protein 53 n=1 Tax=Iris pallida TaxID=29817 RepID=A0AAX6HL80_IRIPA|nr:putative zinc finger CCCH domain-containing protein 53 [Iris pallida]
MDAYEATRVVFSRIQALDPENAAKIMGLLLIQDHGEKEMIRLAFGPETLLHSVTQGPEGAGPAAAPALAPFPDAPLTFFALPPPPPPPLPPELRHHRVPLRLPPPAPAPAQHNLPVLGPSVSVSPDCHQSPEDLMSPANYTDEISLQDQLLLERPLPGDERRSGVAPPPPPTQPELLRGGGTLPRLGRSGGGGGLGLRLEAVPVLREGVLQERDQLQLLRSKSQRLTAAAAGAFPYSPTGSMNMPLSPSTSKCMSFLLQQQNDNQRAAAAAAAAASLMLGGDDSHKFTGRSRLDRADFAGMVNPGSRQIYLTFPADSTFREEDVSNYFSIYGLVQDVRIPYQQKRMFGFVTFVYPETVKLILAKGNPHFVCDARVLVKPYKEKGKVPDKTKQGERSDFSGCTTPTGLDSRDPYDLQQLGARMLYNSSSSPTQEMFLRRKLEEQQQAADLQQAIELQGRRFMGLQLMDFKPRSFSSSSRTPSASTTHYQATRATKNHPRKTRARVLLPLARSSRSFQSTLLLQSIRRSLQEKRAPMKIVISKNVRSTICLIARLLPPPRALPLPATSSRPPQPTLSSSPPRPVATETTSSCRPPLLWTCRPSNPASSKCPGSLLVMGPWGSDK